MIRGEWACASTDPGAADDPSDLAAMDLAWVPAEVPGTVAAALRAQGLWTSGVADRDLLDGRDWWFRCRFADPGNGPWLLQMGGLATLADVWLNGVHLLHSDDMFVEHELEIDCLRPVDSGERAEPSVRGARSPSRVPAGSSPLEEPAGSPSELALDSHVAAGAHGRMGRVGRTGRAVAAGRARPARGRAAGPRLDDRHAVRGRRRCGHPPGNARIRGRPAHDCALACRRPVGVARANRRSLRRRVARPRRRHGDAAVGRTVVAAHARSPTALPRHARDR